MLHIKIDVENSVDNKSNCIKDVEKQFEKIVITGTEAERQAIELVENGKYLDSYSYIDRFGYKLPITELSTGCKTILCVLNTPNQWIDTIESGINAVSVLISICKEGKIIVNDFQTEFITADLNTDIDVELNGLIFHDYDELNDYIVNNV